MEVMTGSCAPRMPFAPQRARLADSWDGGSRPDPPPLVSDFGWIRWPWPDEAPVHVREQGRFAKFPDGHFEYPDGGPGAVEDAP